MNLPLTASSLWHHTKINISQELAFLYGSLFSVTRYNSLVLFQIFLCKFSDFWLLELNFTKFFMSFFKPRVSFPLNFASPFTVMIHNSWEIFQLKYYIIWTRLARQSTAFQIFECSEENLPISWRHFWKHKVRAYSNFAALFSVMNNNSSTFFYLRPSILWTKGAHRQNISDFGVVGWKFTKFLMSYLKPKVSFSLNFASPFQCHER